MFKPPILIACALLMTGCAVPYVEPTGGPTVSLRLENRAPTTTARFGTFDDAENCKASTVRRITIDSSGNWDIKSGETFDVRIKAEEAFTINAIGNYAGAYCEVVATFRPVSGTSYVASFDSDSLPGRCYLSIERRDMVGKRSPERSVRQRVKVAGITNDGNSCK
jgi:hypothetical protein